MVAPEHKRVSTRATGVVGIAILSSRILGLIREQIFAGLFGAGKYLDAFLMAFRLPNLLRDLFAEGALSTAFITTFSGKIATEGDESAWRLANKVATLTAGFMSVVTLIGGMWQLTAQFPSLRRVGYKYRADFRWGDEGVRAVLTLMAPAIIAASAVQVNVLINSGFAASLGNGPVSWLNIAFRLMQLPLGIFGVAIGTVTLPLVAKSAAIGNIDEFRAILARGMRLAFLLTIPSAIGLTMLASPIISVIYQHGRFTAEMTRQTAGALQFYAVGLVSYAVLKVLTPAFYAVGKRNTPMVVSFLAIGTNLFLNWLFTFRLGWGHRGLAFSTSLVATINFLLLYWLMWRHTRTLETRQMLIGLGKICVASALLVLVCWAANHWWLDAWARLHFFPRLCALLLAIAFGATTFFGSAFLLRVPEVQDLVDLLRRRISS